MEKLFKVQEHDAFNLVRQLESILNAQRDVAVSRFERVFPGRSNFRERPTRSGQQHPVEAQIQKGLRESWGSLLPAHLRS